MIVVYPYGNGFRWKMIGACGRDLVIDTEVFPTDHEASRAACRYRTLMWTVASQLERMAGAF